MADPGVEQKSARILLDVVRQKLLTHERHEQSCFTPKKSIVDRILALRILNERLRDFCTGLLAAYVDIRKAFDSVNQDVLWRILAFRRIPPKARQPNIRPVFWYKECCDV